jgi:general secretion pathway protein I
VRYVAAQGQRARAHGFTLIEVLVALAIVAIGMAAVLGALTSSADTVSYLRDKTFAQWVALNRIATVRLSGQLQSVGNSDGDTDFAGRSWHWRQEVTATEVPGVMRIDVKVRPADIKTEEDSGWFTTVSGIQGDAVGASNGYMPLWGAQVLPGQGPQTPGAPGTPGAPTTPGAPGTLGAPATPGAPVTPSGTPTSTTPTPLSAPQPISPTPQGSQ